MYLILFEKKQNNKRELVEHKYIKADSLALVLDAFAENIIQRHRHRIPRHIIR